MIRFATFVLVVSLSTSLFAQPGAIIVKTGCFTDTQRTCEFMAAADWNHPPFLPCAAHICVTPFGVAHCQNNPEGLTSTTGNFQFHDVDHIVNGAVGRTGVNHVVSPLPCGDIFACSCNPLAAAGTPCANGAYKRGYHPIEYSTVGPLNCQGWAGYVVTPWP